MSQMLVKVDTLLTADSVEWCPAAGLEEILACGTYQLNQHENSSTRLGSLLLFHWDGQKLTRTLESDTTKHSFGILDMKWKTDGDRGLLATATSRGTVHFFELYRSADHDLGFADLGAAKVTQGEESQQDASLHLSLSLDWGRNSKCVAVSDSRGQVGIVELCESGSKVTRLWKAHDYEAWITCFGKDERVVFSGGDDCKLRVWDLRVGTTAPLLTSKWHSMGVCSLQVHPDRRNDNILCSGSYDENLALWDVRSMTTPLKDLPLGGGIWRVKWHPSSPGLLAAACMHNHFVVVDTHVGTGGPMEVVGGYKGHASLAYGVDWCRERASEDKHVTGTLASCSFYDHSMHLWNTTLTQKS